MLKFARTAIAGFLACAAMSGAPGLAQSTNAGDDHIQLSTGIDYSSGDYGDVEDTDMLAVPISLKYQSGDFYLRASTGWVEVTGPEGFIPGDGGVTPGVPGGAITTRSGIADTNITVGRSFYLGNNTFFDAVGKVKLPTASAEDFLGTGSVDFTAQGELLHTIDNVSFSARGGRRFNGDGKFYDLRDVWLAGAGVYVNAENMVVGLDYEWREGSILGAPDRSEATASLTVGLTESLRLQGYGYTGFTDGSPDFGAGAQLLLRVGR